MTPFTRPNLDEVVPKGKDPGSHSLPSSVEGYPILIALQLLRRILCRACIISDGRQRLTFGRYAHMYICMYSTSVPYLYIYNTLLGYGPVACVPWKPVLLQLYLTFLSHTLSRLFATTFSYFLFFGAGLLDFNWQTIFPFRRPSFFWFCQTSCVSA